MDINLHLSPADMPFKDRVDLIAEIAEAMSLEANETPKDAIAALLAAAALIARVNTPQTELEHRQTLMPMLLNAIAAVGAVFPEAGPVDPDTGSAAR